MTDGPDRLPVAWSSEDQGVTPAHTWRRWLDELVMPPAIDGSATRILVVSAHPDDEALGAGGFIADAVSHGIHVSVLCLSDGAGSHPESPTVTPRELIAIRRNELDTAMAALGVSCVVHRGLPDGALELCGPAVDDAISEAVAGCGGHDLIVSVWRADRHPDHDAVGSVAATVSARIGIRLLEYPVWMWHWSEPGDRTVPWPRAHRHRLSPAATSAKRRAVHAFVSQITDLSDHPGDRAVLAPHVLERLMGPTETFFA